MKKLIAALTAALLIPLSGCLDARNLDEYGYVLGMGVDPGDAALYRVSFMIQKEGPSAETTSSGFDVVTAEADTLAEAVMLSETGLPYELNLSRTNFLMISDTLAESGLLESFLSTDFSAEKIRPSLNLLVTLGGTADFMNGLKNDADPNTAKMQATMLEISRNAGSLPLANLALFMEGVRGGRFDSAVPLGVMDERIAFPDGQDEKTAGTAPALSEDMTGCFHGQDAALTATVRREGGLRSAFAGSAVFAGCRMAGVLSALHTEILLMARGEYHSGILKLTDGEGRTFSIRLTAEEKPDTALSLYPAPSAEVKIRLAGSLEMENSAAKGLAPLETDALEECAEFFIERELRNIFSACRDSGADTFGFGRLASMRFADADSWEAYGWRKQYEAMTAEFSVEVELVGRENTSPME